MSFFSCSPAKGSRRHRDRARSSSSSVGRRIGQPCRRAWRATQLALGILAIAPCAVAHAQSFGAKPGTWENTVTISEVAIPPPDVLATLPPDERALVDKQIASNEGKPKVREACVTQESLDHGFMPQANPTCKIQIVSRTATKLVATTFCQEPLASSGTMTWEAKSPESVVGSIDQQGGGRNLHIHVASRWKGPTCHLAPSTAVRTMDRLETPAASAASGAR